MPQQFNGMASGDTIQYVKPNTAFAFLVRATPSTGYAFTLYDMTLQDSVISWGDGTSTESQSGNRNYTHTYTNDGVYFVRISGAISSISFAENKWGQEYHHMLYKLLTPLPDTAAVRSYMLYQNVELDYICPDFFGHCIAPTSVSSLCSVCGSLSVLPNIFGNQSGVTETYGLFMLCENLTSVSKSIFASFSNATVFSQTFYNCRNLRLVDDTLFSHTMANDFYYAFGGCTALQHCPPLWEQFPSADGRGCFNGCVNADNYAQVPSTWK